MSEWSKERHGAARKAYETGECPGGFDWPWEELSAALDRIEALEGRIGVMVDDLEGKDCPPDVSCNDKQDCARCWREWALRS